MVRQFAIVLALVTAVSCNTKESKSPISGTGAYPVNLSMGAYSTASISQFLIPSAYAAVSDLKLCFKRLRFKTSVTDIDDPAVDENIDLALGEVTISTAGTMLATVNVPAGTYYRVEFDLEPSCAGKSLSLINDYGSYSSTSGMKIKFDGVFVVDGTENLQLGVQDILDAANAYNGSESVRTAFESVSGNF